MGIYQEKVFPWLVDHLEGKELLDQRKQCVTAAEGDVLEIGFGTGSSLEYYTDKATSLTAVEPSDAMNIRSRQRIEGFSKPFRLIHSSGESLPLDNESYDSVVIMLTLCSVKDPVKVLDEVFRVLRPGGKFYFLEHVASDQAPVYLWQNRLNGLSRFVGCGCNLNGDIKREFLNLAFGLQRFTKRSLLQNRCFHRFIHSFMVRR